MIRGGNFNNNATNLRAANRNNNTPSNHNNNVGFRCAKTVISLPARAPRAGLLGLADAPGAVTHSPPHLAVRSSRARNVPSPNGSGPPYAEPPLREHAAGGGT